MPFIDCNDITSCEETIDLYPVDDTHWSATGWSYAQRCGQLVGSHTPPLYLTLPEGECIKEVTLTVYRPYNPYMSKPLRTLF